VIIFFPRGGEYFEIEGKEDLHPVQINEAFFLTPVPLPA